MKNESPASSSKGSRKIADRLKNIVTSLKSKSHENHAYEPSTESSTYIVSSQKQIHVADDFLDDCDKFIQNVEQILKTVNKISSEKKNKFDPLRVTSAITKWRVKKRGGKVFGDFESLQGRASKVEGEMKVLIDESLRDSEALSSQSEHLQARLGACIRHNEQKVRELRPSVEEAEALQGRLREEKALLQTMLCFFDEVMRLKDRQVVPYVPWAQRMAETPGPPPVKRRALEKREKKIDRALSILDVILKKEKPRFTVFTENLSHCSRSLNALKNFNMKLNYYKDLLRGSSEQTPIASLSTPVLIRRLSLIPMERAGRGEHGEGRGEGGQGAQAPRTQSLSEQNVVVMENPTHRPRRRTLSLSMREPPANSVERHRSGSQEFSPEQALHEALALPPLGEGEEGQGGSREKKAGENYDHSHCMDCSCVYVMANECAMHLAASHHFSQEGVVRLQKVFSYREKMLSLLHSLEEVEHDGDHLFHHES